MSGSMGPGWNRAHHYHVPPPPPHHHHLCPHHSLCHCHWYHEGPLRVGPGPGVQVETLFLAGRPPTFSLPRLLHIRLWVIFIFTVIIGFFIVIFIVISVINVVIVIVTNFLSLPMPPTYPCQWTVSAVSGSVSEWVVDSFRFGDSYRISELCELVWASLFLPQTKSTLFVSHHFKFCSTYQWISYFHVLEPCLLVIFIFWASLSISSYALLRTSQIHQLVKWRKG